MTGAYIRIQRNGKWQPVECDQFTDEELEKYASEHPEDGWRWAKFLAAWIRDNVKEEQKP